jgi:hypothetical protein
MTKISVIAGRAPVVEPWGVVDSTPARLREYRCKQRIMALADFSGLFGSREH